MIRFAAFVAFAILAGNVLANSIDTTPADTGFVNARAQIAAAQ
jgi:hypothetical protein